MTLTYDLEPGPETARLTADVVLFASDPRRDLNVLLIKRRWNPFEGRWALPGGHVDTGEQTMAAARRELTEETGIRVSALAPFAVYGDVGRDPRGRYVTFAYTARLPESAGLPKCAPADDAADARWVLVNDVIEGKVRLAFDHARIIDDALRVVIEGA